MVKNLFPFLRLAKPYKEDELNRTRLFSYILLSIIMVYILVTILDSILIVNAPSTLNMGWSTAVINIIAIISYGIFYLLNKRGQSILAIMGALITGIIHLTLVDLFQSFVVAIALPFTFSVCIMIAGIFLSQRLIMVTLSVVSVITLWLYMAGISTPEMVGVRSSYNSILLSLIAIGFFTLTGAISWTSNWLVSQALGKLDNHNQLLTQQSASQITREKLVMGNIDTLVEKLSTVSARQQDNIVTQTSAVSEVSATLTHLLQTANNMATMTQHLNKTLELANQTVKSGYDLIERSLSAIESNRQQVQVVTNHIDLLFQRTDRLNETAKELKLMADNTTVIAMNAQIESAGAEVVGRRFAVLTQEIRQLVAGQNAPKGNSAVSDEVKEMSVAVSSVSLVGRRFAAVANEVRELANTAHTLSTSVTNLIKDLQVTQHEIRKSNESSTSVVAEVEKLINSTQISVNHMVNSIDQTTTLTSVIAHTTAQQSQAINEINITMQRITESALINTQNSDILMKAIKELSGAAITLSESFSDSEHMISTILSI